MSAITPKMPDELADRLRQHEASIPEILELGLREWTAETQNGFEGATDVLEFLAGLPSPEEVVSLRPSERLKQRVQTLVEVSRAGNLSPQEAEKWEPYQSLEHLARMAKAKAFLKMGEPPPSDA